MEVWYVFGGMVFGGIVVKAFEEYAWKRYNQGYQQGRRDANPDVRRAQK